MIEFNWVKYKNFQSVGNQFIKIDLNRSPSTLISGKNGSGKSCALESISYCLYGKSLKKVVLADLINDINKKNLVTEIEFVKNGSVYRIIRGEKPKILEFYKDNELLNQDAAMKDTQAKIEYILGFDHKTFCQMIIINKERYIPFMDQSPAIRRKVIEDILDISIISAASDITKNYIKDINKNLSNIEYNRAKLIERKAGIVRLIEQRDTNVEQQKNDIKQKISNLKSEASELSKKIDIQKAFVESLKEKIIDSTKLIQKRKKLSSYVGTVNNKLSSSKKILDFFGTNDNCPTCNQVIEIDFKNSIITKETKSIEANKTLAEEIESEIESAEQTLADIAQKQNDVTSATHVLNGYNNDAIRIVREIVNYEAELEKKSVSVPDNYETELDEVSAKITEYENSYMDESDKLEIYNKLLNSLKDTGVKSIIINEYIDFINKKINEYLKAMEFWCVVTLDESFNETIKMGQRTKVSYDSFSTGQKSRLNLAIFLALTEVSNIKNSVSTNILMLDEIFENVDAEGVANIMTLCNNILSSKNIFVITQRSEEFRQYFRSEISFELDDNDFTVLC